MYLIELFSEKEDQVRLITFLLSALLAVSVLLANQYFTYVRARRDLLLSKIEALYRLSIEYTDVCSSLLDEVSDQGCNREIDYPTVSPEYKRKVQGVIRQMEMICGLYFPGSGFDPDEYRLWRMELLEHLEKGRIAEEGEVSCLWQEARRHVVDSDARLAVICSRLMRKYGYQT